MPATENERARATALDWAEQAPLTPFAGACTLVFDDTIKRLIARGLSALKKCEMRCDGGSERHWRRNGAPFR